MQTVLDYLIKNKERFISELCDYLRIPSVSAQPAHRPDMIRCADWLANHCRAIGLDATVHPTSGHPIVVATTPRSKDSHKPHFVVYGHYDVQPPDPLELWNTPPFEPRIQGRSLFARGASDNKGQHFAHIKAVEAFLKTGTDLPCDLTFLIEGEEEVGSTNLESFLKSHREALRCQAVVISDTGIPSLDHPALTCGLRGIFAVEITLNGPSRDLHSGIYGGTVENPAMALCQLLAKLRDDNGHITIPGFYDDVAPLSKADRKEFARLPGSAAAYRKLLGSPQLFGENGFTYHEQRGARPTIEINGLTSGYQGEGSKTIVPSSARAKLTFRLVPNQKPERIQRLVLSHLRQLCPPTVRMKLEVGHGGEPYLVSSASPLVQAALRTLKTAFGHEPLLVRDGGSIPIVTQFKKILCADSLLLGLSLPDDNLHSPNEKFSLDAFDKGMRMSALLWKELE